MKTFCPICGERLETRSVCENGKVKTSGVCKTGHFTANFTENQPETPEKNQEVKQKIEKRNAN